MFVSPSLAGPGHLEGGPSPRTRGYARTSPPLTFRGPPSRLKAVAQQLVELGAEQVALRPQGVPPRVRVALVGHACLP